LKSGQPFQPDFTPESFPLGLVMLLGMKISTSMFHLLPTTLTYLNATIYAKEAGFQAATSSLLPPNIVTLVLHSTPLIIGKSLPAALKRLSISLQEPQPWSCDLKFFENFPLGLTELKIQSTNSLIHDHHLIPLKDHSHLRALSITTSLVHKLSHIYLGSKAFQFLPRSLETFYMPATKSLDLLDFKYLPPGLQKMRMTGSIASHSPLKIPLPLTSEEPRTASSASLASSPQVSLSQSPSESPLIEFLSTLPGSLRLLDVPFNIDPDHLQAWKDTSRKLNIRTNTTGQWNRSFELKDESAFSCDEGLMEGLFGQTYAQSRHYYF
jgi:hypothetical protein